ncbi:BMP family ABC transporter substrate-binding protein [Desulfopila aestuarii]|nr:BMP family ABC transporter substrate-binding protein [Desulfopila aestuarii]
MRRVLLCVLCCLSAIVLSGCEQPPEPEKKSLKIGMVLDTGGDNDHGFNEYSLRGAREAAEKHGIAFDYVTSESSTIFERNLEKVIGEGADLIFTVGFWLANATAKAALRYPERHFVIMDYAYYPGQGCPEAAADCYTKEGGLQNVTSLIFSEDQAAYLAGVLAACMSINSTIGTVAGYEIPPVVRFVEGFEKGARSVSPDIVTFKQYIPDFYDSATGYAVGTSFLIKGADVLFCVGGTTGLGGLKAAKENGAMAIGVDVDQYLTYPEAGSALITSVMKNVDVAARIVVEDFATGRLKAGIRHFTLKNDAVGLAPFHDWAQRIPRECVDKVEAAKQMILADPAISLPDGQKKSVKP